MREDVLLALHPEHSAATRRGPVRLAACEDAAWASGHRGTGLDAVVRNICNRLGGFEPEIRHRSDDGLVLSALVASGRAVALLPALLATAMPQISARRLRDERLQRTIFTAARVTAAEAPAVVAVREALLHTARRVAARQRNLEVLP
jgi:DNA-binding transcriptional LysR family regulator